MNILLTRLALSALSLATAATRSGQAATLLPPPAGKVILTISGRIGVTNKADIAEFDYAMLEALGMDRIETTTLWYNGIVRFDGIRMLRLLQAAGASGEKVTAVALNDYITEIPVENIRRYGVLLAMKRDGSDMPLSDKGPLFIVYPYDSQPELKSQRYYSRSAWQVARLEVT